MSLFGTGGVMSLNVFINKEIDVFKEGLRNAKPGQANLIFESILNVFLTLSTEERHAIKVEIVSVYLEFSEFWAKQGNVRETIKYLKEAIKFGSVDFDEIKNNPSFFKLLSLEEFVAFVTQCKLATSYKTILKQHLKYNDVEHKCFPSFTYVGIEDSELTELRNAMKLEKIAGQGNDIDKSFRIMHWLRSMVEHDGNTLPDIQGSSLEILRFARKQRLKLNCKYIATIFKDCLLAIGIRCRILICRPKNILKIDRDHHVINVVYSSDRKKWIWIDPVLAAYVVDEQKQLIGVFDVQQRLINDEYLDINSKANW